MKKKETYISPKVRIQNSKINGNGMFALKYIDKGEIIIEWGGIFLNYEEVKSINKELFLIIQVEENLYSVESREEFGNDYFINHSCNSNTGMLDGKTIIAIKDIEKGEEITIDYSLFESENYISKWNCNCGEIDCRGKITGKDYLIENVKNRYFEYFSPIIKKKIK